ncbi:MAG: hypothetical protein ACAH80_16135 [Alphaproteobacteria bacterium]
MAKAKKAEKQGKSEAFKEMLSAQVGGEPNDWSRTKKKEVIWNDIDRTFKNKKTGQEVIVCERADGLIYTIAGDEENGFTARLPFNAAAKPATVDVVMNMILASRPEIDDDLYEKAMKEGLAKRFSFSVTRMDNGELENIEEPAKDASKAEIDAWKAEVEETKRQQNVAFIYPATRDATFRAAAYIRPLVPKADSVDDCGGDYYVFDKDLKTLGQIVKYLQGQGLTWDEADQKRDKKLYAEIKEELGVSAAPAAKSKAPKR